MVKTQKEPNVIRMPTDGELTKLFKPYALEIGRLVYSWNRLQERLARLFVLCCGPTQWRIAGAVWYSSKSDLAQRAMLKAVVGCRTFEGLPKAQLEIIWLLNYIDNSLADRRNDVIHSPFSFMTDAAGTRLKSDHFSENPRAKKLFEKELLAEFTWYQLTASVLSGYASDMHLAIALPDRHPWPTRPKLPTLGQKRIPRRKRARLPAVRLRAL
jgi:hypothetical protein